MRTSHDVYNFAYTLKLKAFGVEYVGGSTGIASASSAAAPAISAAGGELTVSSEAGIRSVTVADLSGRTVSRVALNTTSVTLGTSSLSGVYVVTVDTPAGIFTRKVVF